MPFIPILNTVLLVAQYQDAQGVLAINRHYLATTSVPTETDLEECADIYTDSFTEFFVDLCTDNWTLTGVVCRAMNEEAGLEFVASAGVPQNGANNDAQIPNQVSYTCTWLTGLVGRSFRGRTYAIGMGAGAILTGNKRLSDAAQAQFNAAWNGLREAFETGGHAMQVVSLSDGGIPREEGLTTPVLLGRVNFPLATQRRRLR